MSQAQKLLNLLLDGEAHRTDEIMQRVYGGEHLGLSRVGARIYDIKKRGHRIEGWRDPRWPTLYWYRLMPPAKPDWLKYPTAEKKQELARLF